MNQFTRAMVPILFGLYSIIAVLLKEGNLGHIDIPHQHIIDPEHSSYSGEYDEYVEIGICMAIWLPGM